MMRTAMITPLPSFFDFLWWDSCFSCGRGNGSGSTSAEGWCGGVNNGFDVQGHCVSAVCVGGLAESSDVRGDLDKGRILNTFLAQCLDFGVEDLSTRSVPVSARSRETSDMADQLDGRPITLLHLCGLWLNDLWWPLDINLKFPVGFHSLNLRNCDHTHIRPSCVKRSIFQDQTVAL